MNFRVFHLSIKAKERQFHLQRTEYLSTPIIMKSNPVPMLTWRSNYQSQKQSLNHHLNNNNNSTPRLLKHQFPNSKPIINKHISQHSNNQHSISMNQCTHNNSWNRPSCILMKINWKNLRNSINQHTEECISVMAQLDRDRRRRLMPINMSTI